jgi:deoxyadenosine/deoxycytidine kinase
MQSVNRAIISIEGNIGAGKTTILNKLQEKFRDNKDVVFVREPVDLWEKFKDSDGTNMLTKFYQDPKKYAFAFQIMAFTTRAQLLRQAILDNPESNVFFCERSLESDKEIFAKMLHHDGMMDEIMFQVYNHSFQEYLKKCDKISLDHIFYLDVSPDECAKRIQKRGREGEDKISEIYLKRCHDYHNEWLFNTKTPTYMLNSSIEKNLEKIESLITCLVT